MGNLRRAWGVGWAESRRTQPGLALLSHQCRVWVQAGQDRIPLEDSVHKHTNKDIRLGWTPHYRRAAQLEQALVCA